MNSLTKAKNFVADAFLIAPLTPFVPENIKLGSYTFLPWVRSGLAAQVINPAAGSLRAAADIEVTVQGDNGSTAKVDKKVTLRGPGDVVGIDSHEIVRRVPASNSFNVEESFLAHIEFNRPELPWLFSPLAPDANDHLKPWLALVVCEASRATLQPGAAGLPQQLITHMSELQPLDDVWAWAHAQVIGPPDGASVDPPPPGRPATPVPGVDDRLTEDYAPINLSRILCPRKLDPGKSYIACLVPTFDCGVKAGLGQSGGTLDPAWQRNTNDGDQQITLPVYDSWRFSIGEAGDFESLAERLVGMPAPWQIGRRMIDASAPRGGIQPLPAGTPGEMQVLRCALVSPTPIPDTAPAAEMSAWTAATRDVLRTVIDTSQGTADLPRVGPRVYAQFQRAQKTIGKVFGDPPATTANSEKDWFTDLNTAPMHRIVAGLGTRVVQKDREPLMQGAWQQVGDINAVNLVLTRIQFGRFLGEALLDRHFAVLGLGELAQTLRGVQGKIRMGGSATTVHGMVGQSRVPAAAMTAAFRRATRTRGPVGRVVRNGAALRQMLAAGESFKDMRLTYAEPDGVSGLSDRAIAAIPPEVLARKLGVPAQTARKTATEKLGRRPGATSTADRVLAPASNWHVPATIDVATAAATRINEAVDTAPASLGADPARAEAIAPLLLAVANGSVGAPAQAARLGVQRIHEQLPFSSAPAPVAGPNIGHVGGVAIHEDLAVTRAIVAARAAAGTRILNVPAVAPIVAAHAAVAAAAAPAAAALAPAAAINALQRFETATSHRLITELAKSRAVPASTMASALSQFAQGIGVAGMKPTPDRPASWCRARACSARWRRRRPPRPMPSPG